MIIGLTGAAGSGKDTAADALVESLGYQKHSFARPLKEMLCKLLRVPMPKWDDREWKETPLLLGVSPRELAQTLGTEWGRKLVHPDVWVVCAMASMPSARTVFSDVRFPNEAEAIRRAGGKIVYLEATGKHTLTEHAEHESERPLPSHLIDHTIRVPRGAVRRLQLKTVDYVRKASA